MRSVTTMWSRPQATQFPIIEEVNEMKEDVATRNRERRKRMNVNKPHWYRKACEICKKRVTTRGRTRHLNNHVTDGHAKVEQGLREIERAVALLA